MFPLFETVRLVDGVVQNAQLHQDRFAKAYFQHFHRTAAFDIFDQLSIPSEAHDGTWKMKIQYDLNERRFEFSPYQRSVISSLRLVEAPLSIDYSLKYADRSFLDELLTRKKDADDILIVRNGRLTDSSYTNVLLSQQGIWYTPVDPLLRGTMRQSLLDRGLVSSREIFVDDLEMYDEYILVNAMRPMDERDAHSVTNICW